MNSIPFCGRRFAGAGTRVPRSGLLLTFGASMVLGAVCLCSCYRKASRLLTGTLTAMLGGALLVLAVWDIEEVDILDPVWTGSDDGLMSRRALALTVRT